MFVRTALRGVAATALMTLACAAEAHAGGDPPSCGHYEWITVCKTVEVPYTKVVILYDHCGRPVPVEKTGYRTVQVAVKKRVFISD